MYYYSYLMAKVTKPQTYRVSPEVDAELRQLAKKYGGVDKSLRILIRAFDSTAWRRIGNGVDDGRDKGTVETRAPRQKGDKTR